MKPERNGARDMAPSAFVRWQSLSRWLSDDLGQRYSIFDVDMVLTTKPGWLPKVLFEWYHDDVAPDASRLDHGHGMTRHIAKRLGIPAYLVAYRTGSEIGPAGVALDIEQLWLQQIAPDYGPVVPTSPEQFARRLADTVLSF